MLILRMILSEDKIKLFYGYINKKHRKVKLTYDKFSRPAVRENSRSHFDISTVL